YTRDHVTAVRLVLDNGDAVSAGRESLAPPAQTGNTHWHDIVTAAAVLLEQSAELVRAHGPRTVFNRCGYLLRDVLQAGALDMPRLLVGSEGTLALFTEATLRTIPLPGGQAVVLLGFASLDGALQAVQRALPGRPSACDLIDRRLLSLARSSEAAQVAALIPPEAE